MRIRFLTPAAPLATLAALIVGLALAGCGEKSEPEIPQGPASGGAGGLGAELQALADENATTAGPLNGAWRGQIRQQGKKPFSLTARIRTVTGRGTNEVIYGGQIDCAGTWRFVSGQGNVARFEEVIDKGAGGSCKGRGVVRLGFRDRQAGELNYEFQGGGVESTGILNKSR